MLCGVVGDQPVLDLLDPVGVAGSGGAAGELGQQRGGHSVDLPAGVAVLPAIDRYPGDTEQPCGVVGQKRVVGRGQGDRRAVQGPRVQRPPSRVLTADLVGHHEMGVQLRVGSAGVVMVERGRDHTGDLHPSDPAVPDPGGRDPLLQHREGVAHRGVMRLGDQRLPTRVRDTPHRAQRFRRREREVKPRNRGTGLLRKLLVPDALHRLRPLRPGQRRVQPCNPFRNPLVRGLQMRVRLAELVAGHRMQSLAEQPGQLFLGHRVALGDHRGLAGVEAGKPRAQPRTRRASRFGVVPGQWRAQVSIAVARGHRLQQVFVPAARRHHADRHHHGRPSPRRPREGPP